MKLVVHIIIITVLNIIVTITIFISTIIIIIVKIEWIRLGKTLHAHGENNNQIEQRQTPEISAYGIIIYHYCEMTDPQRWNTFCASVDPCPGNSRR